MSDSTVKQLFRQCLLLGWGILAYATLIGQSFAIQQYGVQDGLPSSFIYDIVQDQEGFIWISAEGGLCRFDGNRFEKNPIPTGLSTEVIRLDVDSRGQLWIIDLATNIGCYNGDSIRWVQDLEPSYNFQHINFSEDVRGNYWFLKQGAIIADVQGQDTSYQIRYERKDLQRCNSIIQGPDSNTYVISNFGVGVFEDYKLTFHPFERAFTRIPEFGIAYRERLLFAVENELFFYDPLRDSLHVAFPQYQDYFQTRILSLLYHGNNLWVSTKEGALLIRDVGRPTEHAIKLLEGLVTGNVMVDHQGGYWLATHGQGLFYLPNLDAQIIPTDTINGVLTALCANPEGELLLAFDNSLVQLRDRSYQLLHQTYISPLKDRIYETFFHAPDDHYYLASHQLYRLNRDFSELSVLPECAYLKSARQYPHTSLWVGTNAEVGYFESDSTFRRTAINRTYAVEPVGQDQAWIGTISGLYFSDGVELRAVPQPQLAQDIQDIRLAADSSLWIATANDGLWLMRGDTLVEHFTTEKGLWSNHCRKILLDDNYVWIATNQGVNRIDRQDHRRVYAIGKDEGLPSVEITDLCKNGNDLVVATSKGLAIFSDQLALDQQPVKLYFDHIKIEERDTVIAAHYDLQHHQDNIKIEFNGIAFRNAENIVYEYRMVGIDEDWVATGLGVAQYPSLPSGRYTFRLRARTRNTDWSEEKVIAFRVSKAYWEEWWFYLGVVGLSAVLAYLFIQAIITDYQRRNAIQEKLKNSQLIALRARMNPHFLFNALNSIQELIIHNDKRSANRYLAQFSRLMRNILNMTDKDEVSLQTEIESLELYLSLEALRFEKDFEFRFDVAQGINTQQIKIPSMLIQPYVENAIIHGLMHRRGLKRLHIGFAWVRPYLVVTVADNGVGRKRAREIRISNGRPHPSTGMGLTKNRLDLLNSTQQDQLSVQVVDLEDEDGRSAGTQVTVYIALRKPLAIPDSQPVDSTIARSNAEAPPNPK
ncbi:MAG: histidine kinase [Bacteroidota bacterium]